MAVSYLKKASKSAVSSDPEVRPVVAEMLSAIEAGSEKNSRDYARKLDDWEGYIVLSRTDLAEALRLAKYFPNERFELSSGLGE